MKVLPCTQTTFFDVDDTLIMWNNAREGDPDAIEIAYPASRHIKAIQDIGGEGAFDKDAVEERAYSTPWTAWVRPHKKHIEQLKLHRLRGHTIIVWSAGGWEWAEAAVKALNLEQYVDLVIEKPTWFYDDKTAAEFMGSPLYLKDE